MDIELKDKANKKIKIPMLPEGIEYSSSARFQEYKILDLGEVKLPKGRNLCTYKWTALFPGSSREKMSFIHGTLKTPSYYINIMEYWRKQHKKLKLIISGTSVNEQVYIDSFSYVLTSLGDYKYTLSLVEAVDLKVKAKKRSSKKGTKKYKVKRNKETLHGVAKKFYKDGTKYKVIYKANKKLIDTRVKRERKKKKSISKYTIFKGQVLTIPSTATAFSAKNPSVLKLQKAINKDKYAKLTANGVLDSKTKNAIKKIFIKRGSRGAVVSFVQEKVKVSQDGICGAKTVAAIRKYQRKHGLSVDGIAGYDTLRRMLS